MNNKKEKAKAHLEFCQNTLRQWQLLKSPGLEEFWQNASDAAAAWIASMYEPGDAEPFAAWRERKARERDEKEKAANAAALLDKPD